MVSLRQVGLSTILELRGAGTSRLIWCLHIGIDIGGQEGGSSSAFGWTLDGPEGLERPPAGGGVFNTDVHP